MPARSASDMANRSRRPCAIPATSGAIRSAAPEANPSGRLQAGVINTGRCEIPCNFLGCGAFPLGRVLDKRRMTFPAELHEPLLAYTTASTEVCRLADEVVNELDELIETSFSGREAERVVKMIEQVELKERESDKKQKAA